MCNSKRHSVITLMHVIASESPVSPVVLKGLKYLQSSFVEKLNLLSPALWPVDRLQNYSLYFKTNWRGAVISVLQNDVAESCGCLGGCINVLFIVCNGTI